MARNTEAEASAPEPTEADSTPSPMSDEFAEQDVAAPDAPSADQPGNGAEDSAPGEVVTLVVATPFVDAFTGYVDDVGYTITPAGTEVPSSVAGTLIEAALGSSVLLTTKD